MDILVPSMYTWCRPDGFLSITNMTLMDRQKNLNLSIRRCVRSTFHHGFSQALIAPCWTETQTSYMIFPSIRLAHIDYISQIRSSFNRKYNHCLLRTCPRLKVETIGGRLWSRGRGMEAVQSRRYPQITTFRNYVTFLTRTSVSLTAGHRPTLENHMARPDQSIQ